MARRPTFLRPTFLRMWLLKAGTGISAVLALLWLPYLAIGAWNRLAGGWRSVFFCYAGSRQFIDSYAGFGVERFFLWRPVPIAVLHHNGAWGLVIASPMSEADFLNPDNAAAFARLQRRIRRIASLIGAREINLAGILPSVLRHGRILPIPNSRHTIVAAVAEATQQVAADTLPCGAPIIVIGGAGYIGGPLTERLLGAGHTVEVVDPSAGRAHLPEAYRGQPALVVDAARKGVLETYVDQMWPGLVVLNETFPRPSRTLTGRLAARGVSVWHLSGLVGRVIPPLPHGYENAVPCCAAHGLPDPLRVRLVQLTASNTPAARDVPCEIAGRAMPAKLPRPLSRG